MALGPRSATYAISTGLAQRMLCARPRGNGSSEPTHSQKSAARSSTYLLVITLLRSRGRSWSSLVRAVGGCHQPALVLRRACCRPVVQDLLFAEDLGQDRLG